MQTAPDATLTWLAVAAIATTASAAVAAVYTWLTARLVRAHTEPNVIMYVRHDESRPTVLQIVIENIGRALASDVTFEPSRPVPAKAWGIEKHSGEAITHMTAGPIVTGIPSLGPGSSRRLDWGQFGGLQEALRDGPVEVIIRYKHGNRTMPPVIAKLEVASFEFTSAVGSELHQLGEKLTKIDRALERVASALDRAASRP